MTYEEIDEHLVNVICSFVEIADKVNETHHANAGDIIFKLLQMQNELMHIRYNHLER